MADLITIQVALRIRPLVESEISRGCKKCLQSFPNSSQVQVIGTEKAFSYNYVFDENVTQETFYNTAIYKMIDNLFKGYNVTILAYGQTGSGKTHSMGTSYNGTGDMGVIPRAVTDIFKYVNNNTTDHEFKITVSFMELYQENLYDLLSDRPRDQCIVDIREDNKGIKIPGLVEHEVFSTEETIKCLIDGSAGRATGATAMNAQSSRSHAIFTITVYMQKKNDTNSATTSKFHLVDLAGSERSKKTKATGERFKEGVNINRGLLALGNVISALGEETASKGYISYRDSKLTRLLQDSLGGNSMTLMIACVSPADYNLEETVSTLRYADRARKIKNKPIINQDPKSAEIARLQQIIQQLRVERIGDGNICYNNEEMNKLREEVFKLQNKNRELNTALSSALAENTSMFERAMLTQAANERLQKKLLELKETYNVTLTNLNMSIEQNADCPNPFKEHVENLESMKNLISDIHVEYKNHKEEIQKHEYQTTSPRLNQHNVNHDLHNSQPDLDEKQEKHTKEQLNLNMELKELNRVLSLKEQLASQLMANADHMVDYAALTENESKIVSLEKEKEELLQQLKNVQTNNASSKISEQRRKRVKELETQISELNKRVVEQARMIKLKERDELKIKQLNNEIQAMKATKVKLIKTMRSEEQKFREWKMQREKDIMRLKDQDRKRQNQIVRMENMHNKQQNVLKRKVEEAVAINKRLKDALAIQKQAQERRGNTGKAERVEQYVEQEIEVMVSRLEAKYTLEQLMDDRAVLTDQLKHLQEDSDVSQDTIQQLTDDIDLRSAQIADLQQKILDSDPDTDGKDKTRWDTIQSMIEAKTALRKLFDLASNIRKKAIIKEFKLEELNNAHEDALNKLNKYEKQLREQAIEHKHQMSEIEKEYEEKVAVVLRQLRGVTAKTDDENIKERLQIQDEALEKMDELRKELNAYKEEVHSLRDKLSQVNQLEKKPSKPAVVKRPLTEDLELESSFDETDDQDNDPDWKKTPLYKRILSMRPKNNDSDRERTFVKRSSDGTIKCSCKGNCSTKLCGCKKMDSSCSDICKCIMESCVNRSLSQTNLIKKLFADSEESDDSFKKPTPLMEQNEDDVKRRRTKKSYFQIN